MSGERPILIGLDIGTARIKALGLGLDGDELAEVERPTPWSTDGDQAEMDPGELAEIIRRHGGVAAAGDRARRRPSGCGPSPSA